MRERNERETRKKDDPPKFTKRMLVKDVVPIVHHKEKLSVHTKIHSLILHQAH